MLDRLKLAFMSVLAVFAPIKTVMIVATVLVIVDFLTGGLAARKRKEKITSAGFSRTVAKTLIYQCAIMTGFLTETYLTGDVAPVSKIITSFIGLTELTSITENLNTINGKPILKTLVRKLASRNQDSEGDQCR